MKCPVCGSDCIEDAGVVLGRLPDLFSPCDQCSYRVLDKNAPLSDGKYTPPCRCGKRFIDEVYAHLYVILVEEGVFSGKEPLRAVGSPLIHPGVFTAAPPFLPEDSLVLLSPRVTVPVAERFVAEVPEIRGVVRSGDFVPGAVDPTLEKSPRTYDLLAGCDVRAGIFPTSAGPLVIYTQQSLIHIEFPRPRNPKIESVERRLKEGLPAVFVDACAGNGTLGLCAALHGVGKVILNDAWYAAAYWSAQNIHVNRKALKVTGVTTTLSYDEMKARQVSREPVLVAETEGEQDVSVFFGDYRELWKVLPPGPVCAVLDLFDKSDMEANRRIMKEWRDRVPGEVFIP
ncbi:MAG TPA: hypothetical protein P5029_03240 [Methanolinea sp.]|nr:hypothetical protein [Methanolinea sp.]HRS92532.1 hypothetical protein [Methanolinea sp.]